MLNLLIDIVLFLSSYVPLFGLASLRFDNALGHWCMGLGIVSFVLLLALWGSLRVRGQKRFQVTQVEDRGNDVAGYLVAYLLPFLPLGEPTARDIAAYILFIALVGIIYVRSELIHINPLLYVAGYRLLSVTVSLSPGSTKQYMLIARKLPRLGDEIWVRRFRESVLLEAKAP